MEEIIDSAEGLSPADKIELRVMDLTTGEVNRYHSLVQDVTRSGINVSMPSDGKSVVPLKEGTPLVVALWKGHADHRFPTRVIKRTGGKIPLLTLAKPKPEQITRSPRREFFRVETRLPATLQQTSTGKVTSHSAVILDMSVSGCRVRTDARIPLEHPVTFDLELPFPPDKEGNDQSKPLRGISGVVKARFGTDSAKPGVSAYLGIQFSPMTNVVQTALLRYVAVRQRELIQKITDPEGVARRAEKTADRIAKKKKAEAEAEAKAEVVPEAAVPQARPTGPEAEEAPSVTVARAEALEDLKETEKQIEESFGGEITEDPVADPSEPQVEPDESVAPPRVSEPVHQETPPGARTASPDPDRKTVLVVDDEEGIRDVLALFLSDEGYNVLQAENGRVGLNLALKNNVDLVLTDLMMPEMNGWRLLATLRENDCDVPVVVITGYMIREGQDVLTNRDVAGYLVKPVKLADLKKVTDRILRAPKVPHLKILAVDDEEDVRVLVRAQLEPEGFEVETASDGQEALSKLVAFEPDLVLMDIVMPTMDGFRATEHIRQLSDVPVLMLTSKTSQEFVKRALSLKVAGYIVKPYETMNLVNRIRQVLQARATKD